MGNATAAASPLADNPAGLVSSVPALTGATEMQQAGDVLAIRSDAGLVVGSAEELRQGTGTTIKLADSCRAVTATSNATAFVVACGNRVLVIDPQNPSAEPEERDVSAAAYPATTAVLTSAGQLVVGNDSHEELTVFPSAGGDPSTITMAAPATQLITVSNGDGTDAVVRSGKEDTTVQDVDIDGNRQGGTLRVGVGVGRLSAGVEGLLLVSDTKGDQLAVYTTNDIIRLHQTAPVDSSPWALSWDDTRRLAWISSTAVNTLSGYQLTSGQPEIEYRLPTIANVRGVASLSDGSIALVSEDGSFQVVEDPTASNWKTEEGSSTESTETATEDTHADL